MQNFCLNGATALTLGDENVMPPLPSPNFALDSFHFQ